MQHVIEHKPDTYVGHIVWTVNKDQRMIIIKAKRVANTGRLVDWYTARLQTTLPGGETSFTDSQGNRRSKLAKWYKTQQAAGNERKLK